MSGNSMPDLLQEPSQRARQLNRIKSNGPHYIRKVPCRVNADVLSDARCKREAIQGRVRYLLFLVLREGVG